MSLSFQLPHPYAVEDRLTLDEREPSRWFSKFLLEVESSGLISLLEDRDPMNSPLLIHLANTRLKNATDSWLVENPQPLGSDGEELRTTWNRDRASFQRNCLATSKDTLLQEWESAAKLWMQKALHDEVWRVVTSHQGTDTAAGIYKFLKEYCHSATPQRNSYYAFERIFTLKYQRGQTSFDTHLALLETRVHEWMTCMKPSADLTGPEVVRWFEEKIMMGAIALSVEKDHELHNLSGTMQATKPDLKSSELKAALKAAAHTREEASAHGDATGSADPSSVRQNLAGIASSTRPPNRRVCDYCQSAEHRTAFCPSLIIDNHHKKWK